MAGDFGGVQVGGDHELADRVGDADCAGELTGLAQHRCQCLRPQGGVGLLLASQHRDHLGAQLATKAQAGEPQECVEAGDDLGEAPVGCPERSGGRGVPDSDPPFAHVLELEGPGPAVLGVADEFTKDPCLVRVGDAAELLLHHRLGQDLRPRQVAQGYLAQLPLVHPGGMLPGHRGISFEMVRTAS